MKINITIGAPQRRTPRIGDTRVTKKHGLQVRVWDQAIGPDGRPYASIVSRGRPVWSWVCVDDLKPWDRHLAPKPEGA